MFSRDEREQIRAALVRASQADANITGAAHLGSAAADRLDDWSDIDFARKERREILGEFL